MGDSGEACAASVSAQPFEAAFHPSAPLLVASLITGHLEVFEYTLDATRKVHSFQAHLDSCRTVKFVGDGSMLLSGSADCSILAMDSTTGQMVARLENAHGAGVNTITTLNETNIASGDDDGVIKVWDTRQRQCVYAFDDVHEDFVADMEWIPASQELISVSGDGTLAIHCLKRGKLVALSDNQEDELLSVTLMKGGKKAVVGSQTGVLNIWTYGDWGDISDRFPGHPESVDALVRCDDDIVFTGSSDGLIRVVQILPNKLLGVIGEHMDCPIERMTLSPDRRLLATASHDNSIKLWDVAYVTGDGGVATTAAAAAAAAGTEATEEAMAASDAEEEEEEEEPRKAYKKKKKGKGMKGKSGGAGSSGAGFFADL